MYSQYLKDQSHTNIKYTIKIMTYHQATWGANITELSSVDELYLKKHILSKIDWNV